MTAPIWRPGTLYLPGAVVRPTTAPAILASAIANPGFESGDFDWTKGTNWTIAEGTAFQGTWRARFNGSGAGELLSNSQIAARPGERCAFTSMIRCGLNNRNDTGLALLIRFYTAAHALISTYQPGAPQINGRDVFNQWVRLAAESKAPAGAAYFRVGITTSNAVSVEWLADNFVLTSVHQAQNTGLVFVAIQAVAAFSASSEPDWPATAAGTVVDGGVTWEAVTGDRVVWEAKPILVSGTVEPTWPSFGAAPDNTINWEQEDQRVRDENTPQSKVVALAASKIFAGDGDIAAYCATVNPLDWTEPEDAGFIPFGLNTYGSEPLTAMGIYRSNLVMFNSKGFQMWQVDEDPANMAILDSVPVGCRFHRSVQPVQNDLVFLSNQGIRSIGIAGASTNLQAGDFGKQIDPLVLEKLQTVVAGSDAVAEDFVVTLGSNGETGYNNLPFQEKGAIIPTPPTVNGESLGKVAHSISSNAWQVLIEGSHPQDLFLALRIEVTRGVYQTFDVADVSAYWVSGGYTSWQWTADAGDWTTANDGQNYDVAFILEPAVPAVEPIALTYVGLGQYWLIFEEEAFVLTVNGSGRDAMSWSRYTFPGPIDDWAVLNGELYLRSGDLVWRVDEEAIYDDENEGLGAGGTDTSIQGYIAWPYLDLAQLGRGSMLVGFDLVVSGEVNVQFAYDQTDTNLVTPPYTVDGDTLPGMMIPMPLTAPSLQMRLTFSPGQRWEWNAAVLYVDDNAMGT